MGLLDDAIREHLDLQRRRGADPTDVERAERDALGPVRRAPESAPGADDEPHDPDGFEPEAGTPEAEPEPFGAPPESEPAVYEPETREPESPEPESHEPQSYEPATEVARPPRRGPAFDQEDDSWSYEDSESAEPAPAQIEPPLSERPLAEPEDDPFAAPAPPPPPPAQAATGGQTEEYDVEAALNSENKPEGAEGEDVLEETPEFLQDTPDHDRLWFEQRPPKDFDFDG